VLPYSKLKFAAPESMAMRWIDRSTARRIGDDVDAATTTPEGREQTLVES
jgi:hypothetical protein